MIVCIAEKPSVARDIAHVIGATQSHDGYMEGNGYQVTWTFGHLCTLKEPNDYSDNWKRWSLAALPMIPSRFGIKLIEDAGIKKQFATIERLMNAAEEIINCGDAGQEGELIQRWVMQKTGAKCPVKRLWISSLTEESIREGFKNLKSQDEYQPLYLAGLSRAIGDWILGMNATRLYTLKYGNRQVLSIGRVQTPTLALIVNRQEEIANFVPKQSWVLSTLYRDTKFSAIARDEEAEAEEAAEIKEAAEKGKTLKSKGPIYRQVEYTTEKEGLDILNAIKDLPLEIMSVAKKSGTEAPPRLYDLTSLQVDCNRKFGFSADITLQIIQSLYEKKFTTYPRVDTTFLSDDIYPKCPGIMNGLFKTTFASKAPYAELVKPLSGKSLKKSKKVFDSSKVTDHHAIIPTGVSPQGLTDMEQKVFDLIARAFIAAFYPDCKFETTTVIGEVKSDSPASTLFRTTGKVIIEEGWKSVFKKSADTETDESEEQDSALPVFVKGESGPHVPSLTEKWTQPPKPYTEATLLRAMETAGRFVDNDELRDAMKENGIGRPSTRAAIIETLFKRKYIRKERKNLIATPTGIDLIHVIHEELLKSPELTGIWEKKLRDIEHKSYDASSFVDELKQQIADIVQSVMADNSNRRIAAAEEPVKEKTATRKKVTRKKATPKTAAVKEGDVCPLCGSGYIIKGKTAYGCSRWKEGCKYRGPLT